MRLFLPAALLALSAVLSAAIAYEAVAPLARPTIETTPIAVGHMPPLRAKAYASPAEERFADIDMRPMFSFARKPLPDIVRTDAATVSRSDVSLVGTILGGARAVALIRIRSTSVTTSAGLGDVVNGWRVVRIDATNVTLRGDGREFVVPLDGPTSRPPSASLPPLTPLLQPSVSASPASPSAAAPTALPAVPAASTIASPPTKPPLPARVVPKATGTIAPEALRGTTIDPSTGEPTL